MPLRCEGLDHRLGLAGVTTLSSSPWSTRTGRRCRRGSGSASARDSVRPRRVRPDEAVQVARLELVRVARERLEVGDAEEADAGREDVAERQRGERRVAAGAAALDRQAIRVDVAAVDEESAPRRRSRRHRRCPIAVEVLPVRPAVAGAAAVVDVDDRDARVVRNWYAGSSQFAAFDVGPPWDRTTSGGSSPAGRRRLGIDGAVEQRVGHPPAGGRERRSARATEMKAGSMSSSSTGAAPRTSPVWPGRTPPTSADSVGVPASATTAVAADAQRRRTRCRASRSRRRCSPGAIVEQTIAPAGTGDRDDRAIGEEAVARAVEDPGRIGELGLHRRERLEPRPVVQSIEVPPAGPVADKVQDAVWRPFGLDDRLVEPARGEVATGRASRPRDRRRPAARSRPRACPGDPTRARRAGSRRGRARRGEEVRPVTRTRGVAIPRRAGSRRWPRRDRPRPSAPRGPPGTAGRGRAQVGVAVRASGVIGDRVGAPGSSRDSRPSARFENTTVPPATAYAPPPYSWTRVRTLNGAG